MEEESVTVFQRDSRRERFRLHNELVCLAKALQGSCSTIDLRNDTAITGLFAFVDGYMNIYVKNAILTNRRGKHCLFEEMFVKARNIRYIHIPERKPIMDLIKHQLDSMNRKPKPKKQKDTFKHKRALLKHLDTVASLGESSKESEDQNPS